MTGIPASSNSLDVRPWPAPQSSTRDGRLATIWSRPAGAHAPAVCRIEVLGASGTAPACALCLLIPAPSNRATIMRWYSSAVAPNICPATSVARLVEFFIELGGSTQPTSAEAIGAS